MKNVSWLIASIITLATLSGAFAWQAQWGPTYGPNGYQSVGTMYGASYSPYTSGAYGSYGGYVSPYSSYSSYNTYGNAYSAQAFRQYAGPGGSYGYYAAPRYDDPVYKGAYSPYTGQYYNTFQGTVQNQNPNQRMNIPATRYPNPLYFPPNWQ